MEPLQALIVGLSTLNLFCLLSLSKDIEKLKRTISDHFAWHKAIVHRSRIIQDQTM